MMARRRETDAGAAMRGVTLLELLAALVLTALTVAMATRIFLGAKAQAWILGRQSVLLREAVYLRRAVQDSIQSASLSCPLPEAASGAFPSEAASLRPAWMSAGAWKAKAPDLDSLDVTCVIPRGPGPAFAEDAVYDEKVQPVLAWRAILRSGSTVRSVSGVWRP